MRSPLWTVLMLATLATSATAKLPPLDEDGKLKASEAAAKAAWNDKVGLYQHCQALDRIAAKYRKAPAAAPAGASAVPVSIPPCVDPGAYVSPASLAATAAAPAAPAGPAGATPTTPATAKPLEASGAHSPSGTATSPPSTRAPAAVMTPNAKAPAVSGGLAARAASATATTPVKDKPIEASEAHSPPGTAISPPSTNATNSELTGKAKK